MTIDRTASLMNPAPIVFRHGAFDVTVLSDGHFALPAEVVAPEATPDEWIDIERRLGGRDGSIRANANIPLIRSEDDLTLIDLGGGGKFQPTEGQLAHSLAAAGYDASMVTKVLLTHAHPDHVWGMLGSDGTPRFPNATYYVGVAEWGFWMDPDFTSSMRSVLHEFAKGAQRDLSAVCDRIVLVKDGDEIMPGLHAIATPGHTPGHTSYALAGPETLVVTGDVVTNQIVSFEHPAWRFGNDTDQEVGAKTRQRFVDRAAVDRLLLLGYHFAYPGLGRVERSGGHYGYVPAHV
jgi:glyoxylase-like metal-dependent hydrolase (beta-lactamase superfamily II)